MDGILDAYSALDARMKIVDIITNNLANSQTTGFKRDFGHILQDAKGYDVGTQVDLTTGDLINSATALDAAIDGPGFFAIQTPNGIRYTRNGSFSLNNKGELVTKDGMTVLSTNGTPVTVGMGVPAIQDGGVVTSDDNEVGTLQIVTFTDPGKLQKEGQYRLSWAGADDQVKQVPEPRVKGGYLERSNVNPVTEMVELISAYREYESVQKTIKTMTNDMNSKLVQEAGKLS